MVQAEGVEKHSVTSCCNRLSSAKQPCKREEEAGKNLAYQLSLLLIQKYIRRIHFSEDKWLLLLRRAQAHSTENTVQGSGC